MSDPALQRRSAGVPAGHRVALSIVWALVAVPPALWFVSESDPELAVRVTQAAATWSWRVLLGATVLLCVGALVFPPVPAWIRLRWNNLRLAVTTDRGPLLKALADLQHFESAQRHLEIGRLALLRREHALAAPHLHRAIELEPHVPNAHHLFGLCLLRVGHVDAAATAFANAEHLDPGHAFGDALLHRGRCLDLLGRHAEAVAVLQQHAAKHGGGRRSGYWLGLALLATGDRTGARAAFVAAAARPTQRLSAEENWFRALARVRLWRGGPV